MTPEEIKALRKWLKDGFELVTQLKNRDFTVRAGFCCLWMMYMMICSMGGLAFLVSPTAWEGWDDLWIAGMLAYPALGLLAVLLLGANQMVLKARRKHTVSQGKRIKKLEERNAQLERELNLV